MRHLDSLVLLILIFIFVVGIALAQNVIVPNETVSGTLNETESTQEYIFNGKAGDSISVTASSRMFDTYLDIKSPDGDTIYSNDDFGGSLDSTIENVVIPTDGDYTIVVSSATSDGVGTYDLSLTLWSLATITYGDIIEGQVTPDTPEINYEFKGEAGDTILISMESTEFDTFIDVRDSDFFGLISDDDSGAGTNSLITGFAIPKTGTYIIAARGYTQQASGNYTLRVQRIEVTQLEAQTSVTREVDGDIHVYSFEATAGDLLNLDIVGADGLDTSIVLRGPAGYILISDDDGGDNLNPELHNYWIEESGTYIVIVQSASADSGSYEIMLDITEPEPLACGTEVTLDFSSKSFNRVFAFEATDDTDYELVLIGDEAVYNLYTRVLQDDTIIPFDETQPSLFEYDITPLQESDADYSLYNFYTQTANEVRVLISDYNYREEAFTLELVCE